jgi:phospholipid/cholesterol/gamma-HCH transport system substrate-binding protein
MARDSFATVARRRLLGLLLIAVVVALVTLSIAIYNKAFSTFVDVTLRSDHTGNQLLVDSDVKERGVIVGSVKSVSSKGDGAIVKLELDPARVKDIPSNVKAQILPKTLFGEQYVSLIVPSDPARHIKQGDVIPQDRSKGALETQRVLSDLLPLLTAVSPADLNATLTAVATALTGRGDKLGETLVNMDRYLTTLNPHTSKLVDDFAKLGRVALEYNSLAPDILSSLTNLQTSARTVISRQQALHSLLVDGTDAANVLNGFLDANEQRLIQVTGQTNKIYGLLDIYSPEFSCMFEGISKLYDLSGKAIYNHRIHLTITATTDDFQTQPYKPGQQPRSITGYGPNCFGLPNNPQPVDSRGHFQIPDKFKCLNDGAPLTPAGASASCSSSSSSASYRSLNSPEENAMVNTIVAAQMNTPPDKVPGVATLLAGPLLRGQQVVVK